MARLTKYLILCSCLLIRAQSFAQMGDIVNWDTLTVNSDILQTGSLLDLDIKQLPVSVSVITKEDIYQSGARHLSELLEVYVPGFQYMYNKWNGIIWGMRGVAADRNTKFIFLVNGRKMNQESRDGANSELDLGFLSDLERVEVIRGPGGLLYGSGSIAGVINLITKKYVQDKSVSESMVETWSVNTFGAAQKVLFAKQFENKGSLQVYAGFRASQGTGTGTPSLWGRPSYPYPQYITDTAKYGPNLPPGSVPAQGSSWSTPGNFILSADYQLKDWRAYIRYTHQVTNASGLFVLDPWPEITGILDKNSKVTDRMVNGQVVKPTGFYGQDESWGDNRRQYRVNNISMQVNRDIFLMYNKLFRLNAGVDLVSDRITVEKMPFFLDTLSGGKLYNRIEAFGEKRFNVTGTYIFGKKDPDNKKYKYRMALGFDSRVFMFGNDLSGKDEQYENPKHPVIDRVTYFNEALFGEWVYYPRRSIMLDLGFRYDVHSRTIRYGGLISSRLGLIFTPKDGPLSFRAAFQSSGNNGSADNYEYNRDLFDDNGTTTDHYQHPTRTADGKTAVIEHISRDDLRKIRPEKVFSYELSGLYEDNGFKVFTSFSYNTIKNLFTWNQDLFRVQNSGQYNFFNGEIDVSYRPNKGKFKFGINHVILKLANTNVGDSLVTNKGKYTVADSIGKDKVKYYYPQKTSGVDQVTIYPIQSAISVDGRNFLNLAPNVSKAYIDFMPVKWFSIHSDWRFFWGLNGRKSLYDTLQKYQNLEVDRRLMVKWNAGIRFAWKGTAVQFFVYDLLASPNKKMNINTLRWQQMSDSKTQTDLYGIDFRSYAVRVTVEF